MCHICEKYHFIITSVCSLVFGSILAMKIFFNFLFPKSKDNEKKIEEELERINENLQKYNNIVEDKT